MKVMDKWQLRYDLDLSCFLLAAAVSILLGQFFSLSVNEELTLLMTALAALGVILFVRYRKKPLLYLILLMAAAGFMAAVWILKVDLKEAAGQFIDFAADYDGTEAKYRMQYAVTLQALFCLGACAGCFWWCRVKCLRYFLDIGVAAFFLYFTFYHWEVSVISGILLFVYGLKEITGRSYLSFYRKAAWHKAQKTTACLLPMFLVIIGVAACLPRSSTPIKWEKAKVIYAAARENVSRWAYEIQLKMGNITGMNGGSFFYNTETGTLGGDLKGDDREWLQIHMTSRTHEPLYLAASYKEVYDINRWREAEDVKLPVDEYKLDTYELIYSLLRQEDLKSWRSIMRQKVIDIQYRQLTTRTLFTPAKTRRILDTEKTFTSSSAGFVFKRAESYGTGYESSFMEVNRKSECFINMLKAADDFSYSRLQPITLGYFKTQAMPMVSRINEDSDEDRKIDLNAVLQQRAEYIKEAYTQIPDGFSKRVGTLAESITRGCDTDYDKLKALQSYLADYTYTMTPGPLPKGRELTDYFLFEGRKGYCTYFATAMVMMGRCLGIPMRYVEGVVVDYQSAGKSDLYSVSSSKAHAWAEAYFEGVGWVRFDATPGYETTQYILWPKEEAQSDSSSKAAPDQKAPELSETEMEPVIEAAGKEIQYEKHSERGIYILLMMAAAVTFMLILFSGFVLACYHRLYQKGSNETRFRLIFYEVTAHLAYQHIRLEENETLMQYKRKLMHYEGIEKESLMALIDTYMALRYGMESIKEEELDKALSLYQKLIVLSREKLGILRCFVHILKVRYQILRKTKVKLLIK